ncbi:MAG: hypothetical protein EZS28_043402, partial [Streblomastix strix]
MCGSSGIREVYCSGYAGIRGINRLIIFVVAVSLCLDYSTVCVAGLFVCVYDWFIVGKARFNGRRTGLGAKESYYARGQRNDQQQAGDNAIRMGSISGSKTDTGNLTDCV